MRHEVVPSINLGVGAITACANTPAREENDVKSFEMLYEVQRVVRAAFQKRIFFWPTLIFSCNRFSVNWRQFHVPMIKYHKGANLERNFSSRFEIGEA